MGENLLQNLIYNEPKIIIDDIPENFCQKHKAQLISNETGIPIKYIYNDNLGAKFTYDRSRNWIKINGKWFFIKKKLAELEFINELLGQTISLHFNLDTVNYQIARINFKTHYEYRLISENFFDKNYQYFTFEYLRILDEKENINDILKHLKQICQLNQDTNYFLLIDIIKMSIRDLYAGYIDRHSLNFFFKKKEKIISLAPLFDYENSFIGTPKLYENSLLIINSNNKHTLNLIQNNNIFQEYIEKSLDINMQQLLTITQEKNEIKIPFYLQDFFLKEDKKSKEIIKKLYLKK